MNDEFEVKVAENSLIICALPPTIATTIDINGNDFLTAILRPNGDLIVTVKHGQKQFYNVKRSTNFGTSKHLISVMHKNKLLVFGRQAIRRAVLFKISSSETSRERFRKILETHNKPFIDLPADQDCVYCVLRNGHVNLVYGSPTEMANFHRVANSNINFNEFAAPVFCGNK